MRRCWLFGLVLLLGGCGPAPPLLVHYKPVRYWLEALHDPDPRLRRKAVDALGNVGSADRAVIPALVAAVKDADAGVRRQAVLTLLKLGPAAQEAIPVLTEAHKDTDPRVRSYAAKALERIRGGK
jgi:HEAT repeat protein